MGCRTCENVTKVCENGIPNSLIITKCNICGLTINCSNNNNVFERGILIEKKYNNPRNACRMNGFALEDATINGDVMLNNVRII